MQDRIQKKCDYTVYWIIGLLSMLIFVSIYGAGVINPTYTDWLLSGGDLSGHYLGWRGYRNSAWHFPIGLMDTLTYPEKRSIIFTDSIPLFAVFFKILSPILPDHFQYFGLWGIMCFALQGILAARILKKYTKSRALLIGSSLLFVLAPIMIRRMFGHTALAGQWILLLGLEMVFSYEKYHNNKKIYIVSALIAFFSASVHIYFLLMNGIILVGFCILNVWVYRDIKRSILVLADYILVAIFVVAILGGFSSGVSATAGGLGYFSFNLNALINPMGWSDVFKDLPVYVFEQDDGFAYLGAGVIYICIFACISFAGDNNTKSRLKAHRASIVSLLCIIVISVIVAASPVITFGDILLADISFPEFIIELWSIFRASGRIAWVVVYVIMVGACIMAYKTLRPRTLIVLILFCFILQSYDIHSILETKNEIFSSPVIYESKLQDRSFWESVSRANVRHVKYTSSDIDESVVYSVTDWALDNQMTLNGFFVGRTSEFLADGSSNGVAVEAEPESIYIFQEREKQMCRTYDLNYYQADGLVVGCAGQIPGLTPIGWNELNESIWRFGDGAYINDGIDTENGRLLYPGGLSFGPYWPIPHGTYKLVISGENMTDKTEVSIYSEYGLTYHDFEIVNRSDDEIQINLYLLNDVADLEISVRNNADDEILLKSTILTYVE